MNPVEDLWEILEMRACSREKHFETKQQLIIAIHEQWALLSHELLVSLPRSLIKRTTAVLVAKGKQAKH